MAAGSSEGKFDLSSLVPVERLRFIVNRIRERLWIKPLVVCVLSIGGAFLAKIADQTKLADVAPEITADSVETLLTIMSSSMLVIATFAVASMVSAYASAGRAATPRAFTLVVADDASQNALSTFIGAFIFSIVALVAFKNSYFAKAGLFTLFVLTLGVFGLVILTFVRWVDRIARLGRIGTTIRKVEKATAVAMSRLQAAPTLGGVPIGSGDREGRAVFSSTVGYIQHINVAALQACAESFGGRVVVNALPGTFADHSRPLGFVIGDDLSDAHDKRVAGAFVIGNGRRFDEDPRFGLVVLSEIAARALSPAVNDPGTAIDIIGTLVRLFSQWNESARSNDAETPYDRVAVPALSVGDMFDNAFTAIAHHGAGEPSVAVRLQKALTSLASSDDRDMRAAATKHSHLALERAKLAMGLEHDLKLVSDAAGVELESA